MGSEIKTIRTANFECPWCQKRIKIKVKDEIITPAVSAVKKTYVEAKKDTQQILK